MSHLVIHIVPNEKFQVEGDYSEIKDILNNYFHQNTTSTPPPETSLQDIVYRSLPNSEAEWLLVYAHYLNKDQFTRQDLLTSYKNTQRYSYTISKNLSHNLQACVKNDWITAINDQLFSLTAQGQAHILEIQSRTKK